MRAIVSARVVAPLLVLALLVGLTPALGVVTRHAAVAAPGAQVAGCVVGTELVRNGSFESPGLGGEIYVYPYAPDEWVGYGQGYSGADARDLGRPAVGDVYIYGLQGGLTQALETAGLGGATLTVRYYSEAGRFSTSVRVNDITVPVTKELLAGVADGAVYTGEVTLTDDPGNTVLSFPASANAVDNVSVTITACGDPTASASGAAASDAVASASTGAASDLAASASASGVAQASASAATASDAAAASVGAASASAATASASGAAASSQAAASAANVSASNAAAVASTAAASASTAAIPSPRPSGVRPDRSPRPGAVALPSPSPESARPDRSPRPAR